MCSSDLLDWYSNHIERPNIIQYLPTTPGDIALHINFGRFLNDPVYGLDPTKFTNPQLKITLDKDAGGMNNSQIIMSIFAHLFDEKAATPTGFLMAKEIKDYSLAGGSHEYTPMPTDYPYRKLLLQSQVAGVGVEYTFGNIKLSEDNDKRIPFDMTGDELLWEMKRTNPEYIETVYSLINSSATLFRVTPAEDAIIIGTNTGALQDLFIVFQNGGLVTGTTQTSGETVYMICKGYIPHGLVSLPFGDPAKPADWYDVTKVGDLRLRLKAGADLSTTPTAQIITQQLRPYA